MIARDVLAEVAEMLRPKRALRPSEAATQYLRNDRGPWSRSLTPMMTEPLDALADRRYRAVVLVGPARTGKTLGRVHGAITYAAIVENADTMVVSMSQDAARDFSRTEVDRVIRHSPELAARISAADDFTHDKQWRSGATLKIAWPAISLGARRNTCCSRTTTARLFATTSTARVRCSTSR